jgi:hypothetical protein
MYRDDCSDHKNRQARRWDKPAQGKPRSHRLEPARFLPELPDYIACKKRRNLRPRRPTQEIPQLFVVLSFHCFPEIKLKVRPKVAPHTA